MDEFPFSALFLFAQSCLTDAVNVIFSDYCFTDTYLKPEGRFFYSKRGGLEPGGRARRLFPRTKNAVPLLPQRIEERQGVSILF